MTIKKRLGLSVSISLYEFLKDEAEYTGQTLNGLIRQILWDWLKENEKEKDVS